MAEIRRKLVIVGDGACGKTCLLMCVAYFFPPSNLTPFPNYCFANNVSNITASSPKEPSLRYASDHVTRLKRLVIRIQILSLTNVVHRSMSPPFSRTTSPMSK